MACIAWYASRAWYASVDVLSLSLHVKQNHVILTMGYGGFMRFHEVSIVMGVPQNDQNGWFTMEKPI